MKLLLIEDNTTIASQIVEFLTGLGWQVDCAHNGALGIKLSGDDIFDVVLLDLNLPDIDGLDVCKAIQDVAKAKVPILMLTARSSYEEKYAGFKVGADDYLTKPFDLRELALRCDALAKRNDLHQNKRIGIGDLIVDLDTRQARRNGTILKLTSIGFDILALLAKYYPKPVSRDIIIHRIWGNSPPNSDVLKSHIYSLRLIVDKPFSHNMLETVMSVGYKLRVDKCE